MDIGQKISQLPKSSTPQENDYFPFNTVNESGTLETSVLTLNNLRAQLDFSSAYMDLPTAITNTKVGDKFCVFESPAKQFVIEYLRNDAGASPVLNAYNKPKRRITSEGLQYASLLRTFASVTDLKASTPAYENEVVSLDSYRQGKGIGGGKFVFIKGDKTTVDDGGVVLVGLDGSRWKRVFDNHGAINPTYWGAVPNDSTVDSSSSFTRMSKWAETQPIVDSVLFGNVRMVCSQGRYYLKTPITLQSKVIDYDFSGAMLDFTQLTPGTTAVPTIAISWVGLGNASVGTMECRNLRAVGPGMDTFVNFMHMDGTTSRNAMSFINGGCEMFATGFTYGSNTSYVKFYNFQFNHCNIAYTNKSTMTTLGEQIHFISCFFTRCNIFVNANKAHTVFDNCSFNGALKHFVLVDSGSPELIFNDGWFEGTGPTDYVINVADELPSRIQFNGTKFLFKTGGSKATSNPFFVGNRAIVEWSSCYFSGLGTTNDSVNLTGWVSGKGRVKIIDSKIPNGYPNLLSNIQPEVPEENFIRPALFSDTSFFAHELWIPSPGGTGCEVRKHRLGWGTDASTNFSLQRLNGYIQFGTNTVPSGGSYKLYIGALELKGTGPVAYTATLGSWGAFGKIHIAIHWVDATFFGPDTPNNPIVHKEVKGPYYDLPLTATGSEFKTYRSPINFQGSTGQAVDYTSAPDWATHAVLVLDITNAPKNMSHRITDIYMRQI